MDRIDQYQSLLGVTARSLGGENLARIDFDELKDALSDVVALLEEAKLARCELALLRRDYIARISGMEKAVAVAARSDARVKRALATIDTLPDLPAEELVEQYSKSQARFRDAFPTSFGFIGKSRIVRGNRSISEYK